ncbi:VCBS repeat-containing protein, partial [Candidatus Sumerlaeota bacterium]|nr:VCBS repeat-containing protein [Candidatus Sumerlaeota bacterium]
MSIIRGCFRRCAVWAALILTVTATWAEVPGERFNIDRLGGIVSGAQTLVSSGEEFLILGDAGSIEILSIVDPNRPEPVGRLEMESALALAVRGPLLAVSTESGIALIDVSDPGDPVVLSLIPGTPEHLELALAEGLLFEGEPSGLTVYDIGDPLDPQTLSHLPVRSPGTYSEECGLTVMDDWALLAVDDRDLNVIDVSDPASPELVAAEQISYSAPPPQVLGDRICIATGNEIRVYEMSDPASPELMGSHTTADELYTALDVSGSLAFVGSNRGGLRVFNIASGIPSPEYTNVGPIVSDLTIVDDRLLGLDATGMEIWGLSPEGVPSLLRTRDLPQEPTDIELADDLMLVTEESGSLQVFDVSDPMAPHLLDSERVTGSARAVDVSGELAVVAATSGLAVTSIADPASIEVVSFTTTLYGSESSDVIVRDSRAHLSRFRQLLTVDLSDPTAPELIAIQEFPKQVNAFDVSGELAAVAVSEQGVTLFDISDLTQPQTLGQYPGAEHIDVALMGDLALVLMRHRTQGYPGALMIVDISDPTSPVTLKIISIPSTTQRIAVCGSEVTVGTTEGFEVFDLTDPLHPRLTGWFHRNPSATAMQTLDRRGDLIAAGFINFLELYRTHPPAGLAPPIPLSPGTADPPGPMLPDDDVIMRWDAFTLENSFSLTVSNETEGTVAYHTEGLTGSSHLIPSAWLPGGNRYRWAMTSNAGTAESEESSPLYFRIELLPPELVEPGALMDSDYTGGAGEVYTPTPVFLWVSRSDASCEVTVRYWPDETPVFNQTGLTDGVWSIPPGVLVDGERYTWELVTHRHEFESVPSDRFIFEVHLGAVPENNLFELPQYSPLPNRPTAQLLAMDLNGDNRSDLVGRIEGGVGVMLTNASGELTLGVEYPLGYSPEGLTSADFDGDGDTDLVAMGQGFLSLLRNSGDGVFAPPETTSSATMSHGDLESADFDGDGDIDLIFTSGTTGFTLLLNGGDGTFEAPITIPLHWLHSGLAVGDLDGDEDPDVVIEAHDERVCRLIFNEGGNLTTASAEVGMYCEPSGTILADLDGVGGLDLAAFDDDGRQLIVLRNPAESAQRDVIDLDATPIDLVAADLDADGWTDLALTLSDETVAVFPNLGDGTFDSPVRLSMKNAQLLAAGDFSGDGLEDLAVHFGAWNPNALILNRGQGHLAAPTARRVSTYHSAFALGNLDDDGALDLALVSHQSEGITILFEFGRTDRAVHLEGNSYTALVLGDFDGDADLDLIAGGETTYPQGKPLHLFLNDGAGALASPISVGSGYFETGPTALATADFNGDGQPDVATSDRVLLNTGPGGEWDISPLPVDAVDDHLRTGDLNGDGHQDIVGIHSLSYQGPDRVALLLGEGTGQFAAPRHLASLENVDSLITCDVDADTDLDILAVDSGDLVTLLNDGEGNFSLTHRLAVGVRERPQDRGLEVGDFNEDGFIDVVLFTTNEIPWATDTSREGIRVALGDGTGRFTLHGRMFSTPEA